MALRVDNIKVSEKNVFLLDGRRMLVADIEKGGASATNYWNLYDENGIVYNNLFDISSFDVRSQMLKGGMDGSTDSPKAHEKVYSPQRYTDTIGLAQLYNNVYAISAATTACIGTTYVENVAGEELEYSAGYGFCQYPKLEELSATKDNFISPNIVYSPNGNGVQYLTEFPANGFYSCFGSVDGGEPPTVYGDSVLTKYYLSDEYSVAAQLVNRVNIRFKKMREYYAVGSTGSSMYMVYRNNLTGRNDSGDYGAANGLSLDGGALAASAPTVADLTDISFFCGMDNVLTYAERVGGELFYSADFKKEFVGIQIDGDVVAAYQPKDHTFILYIVSGDSGLSLVYIPKLGGMAARSVSKFKHPESLDDVRAVELEHSVLVGTAKNGLVNVWSKSYAYDAAVSFTDFRPFATPVIGTPKKTFGSFSQYSGFVPFFNGSDILGVTCTDNNGDSVAFLSTRHSFGDVVCEIGQYFQQAVSYSIPHTVTSDILFDYCPVDYGDEVKRGNYAFLQFDGLGLTKCHVADMVTEDGQCIFSSIGPVNVMQNASDRRICTDIRFDIIGHGEGMRSALEQNNYLKTGLSNNFISAKPSLKATFREASGDAFRFSESFSCFPSATARDLIQENITTVQQGDSLRDVEQFPVSGFRFIYGVPIEKSMGVTVKSWKTENTKHDAALTLVKWNDRNGVATLDSAFDSAEDSIGGLHLQYSAICSEVFVNSYDDSRSDIRKEWNSFPSTTVYEYPHPCYGGLSTAGELKLPIFDGPLAPSMKLGDIEMVGELLVVKNYCTTPVSGQPAVDHGEDVRAFGKINVEDVPEFMHGGYVVTNFFSGNNLKASVQELYDMKVVTPSSNIEGYSTLFHIKPSKTIEFYPEATRTTPWKPYYAGKHISFIRKYGNFYYIGLRSAEDVASEGAVGYDIVETRSLFEEQPLTKLEGGLFVTDVKLLGDMVAVQYSRLAGGTLVADSIRVFLQGDPLTKYLPQRRLSRISLTAAPVAGANDPSIPRHSEIVYSRDASSHSTAAFDNVEMVYSLNRFSPNTSHKSNLFSIRIDDLGIDESPYLSNSQKRDLKRWFKNKIIDMVDVVKPAQTELFDVYVN